MKKNLLFTVILPLILVLILVYWFWGYDKNNVSYEPVQLFSTSIENITGISISSNKSENSFELVKSGEEWFFSDNKNLKVIQSKAHSLAYDLSHIFAERTITKNGTNLQQYGLEPAVSIITIRLDDGTVKEFHVGNRLDNGREYYFKMGDSSDIYTLYIGKGQMFTSIRQDFVDKKLTYISRDDIKKITVFNSDKKTVIEKEFFNDGIYAWNITQPIKWNVLESQLESTIIYPLMVLQAKSFDENMISDDEFIESSISRIEVEDVNGVLTNYYFSPKNKDGKCYVKKDKYFPALIESKLCDISEFTEEKIINKRVSSYRIDGWEKAVLYDEGKTISCYALNGAPRKYFINEKEVSNEQYTRYLNNLSELTCNSLINSDNLKSIDMYIEYIYSDGTSLKFDFYKSSDDEYAVTRDGISFVDIESNIFNAWRKMITLTL